MGNKPIRFAESKSMTELLSSNEMSSKGIPSLRYNLVSSSKVVVLLSI